MSAPKRCRHCRAPQVRITTDGAGRHLEVADPCACARRKAAGICRACPAPLPAKRTATTTYCTECAARRKREAQARYARHRRGNFGPPKKAAWMADVDAERLADGICQLCNQPVDGTPKRAAYCAKHRKIRRAAVMRNYRERSGDAAGKAYRERNREQRNARELERIRSSKSERKRRAEYGREWRRKNPDKVRAQKRRAALKDWQDRKQAERSRAWRERVAAGLHQPQTYPRNEAGERLCLDGCGAVVQGRARLCGACRPAA